MEAQQVINKLIVEMILQESFKNRDETKIFMPNSFAHELERDLGIKTFKDLQYAGYRTVCGPFPYISAYNKVKNAQMIISLDGEFLEMPA